MSTAQSISLRSLTAQSISLIVPASEPSHLLPWSFGLFFLLLETKKMDVNLKDKTTVPSLSFKMVLVKIQGDSCCPPISVPKSKLAKQPITAFLRNRIYQQLWLAGWQFSFWDWNCGYRWKNHCIKKLGLAHESRVSFRKPTITKIGKNNNKNK